MINMKNYWKSKDDEQKEQLERELEQERQQAEEDRFIAVEKYIQKEAERLIDAGELDEGQREAFLDLFEPWGVGVEYQVGERVRHRGVVYEIIQAHTSQADWLPASVPALYMVYLQRGATDESGEPVEVVHEWKEPQGGHDAYRRGDRVTFEGKVYESLIESNVWSPAAYPQGWQLIEKGGGNE